MNDASRRPFDAEEIERWAVGAKSSYSSWPKVKPTWCARGEVEHNSNRSVVSWHPLAVKVAAASIAPAE